MDFCPTRKGQVSPEPSSHLVCPTASEAGSGLTSPPRASEGLRTQRTTGSSFHLSRAICCPREATPLACRSVLQPEGLGQTSVFSSVH